MIKPRLSLKQCLGITAVFAVVAWCVANYESFYGVRWTPADAAQLAAELASHDGDITKEMAIRVAIDAAVSGGRVLPSSVERGVWTRDLISGLPVEPVSSECYIVRLEYIPSGISGAFTRIPGGHCTVYVGLDGAVLRFVGGA